jgi:hypothetical protein
LKQDIHIFYGEGEMQNNQFGNLIIKTKVINCGDYYFNGINMYKKIIIDKIPDTYVFTHIDNNKYTIEKNDIIDNKYAIIENIGLLNKRSTRGDLLCEFVIR